VARAGADRYFGGHPGAAARARERLVKRHGAVRGDAEYRKVLEARRATYANRGRGVGLQRIVRGD
jgi:hypothetical protein